MIYGLPVPRTDAAAPVLPEGTVKVSHHMPGPPLERYDPRDPTPLPDDPALLEGLVIAIGRLLPGLDPVPIATERCVYDNSADTDFILDRVGPVVVGCGTSGHGFKFGPLLGELLADLAEGSRLTRRPATLRPAPGLRPGLACSPFPLAWPRCPATSPCSAASTSPATAASP